MSTTEDRGLILIIDDLEEIRHFLRQRLEDFGFRILEAESGKEGAELAAKSNPHIIICDYEMPEMSGIETCRLLKTNEATQQIPIIILSSYPFGKNLIEEMKELEIDAYMMKPYEFDDLLIKINQLLETKLQTMNEPNEKRGTKRFKAGYGATVEINGAQFAAKLVNVSREGICLLIPQKEKIGTELKITFENPDVLSPHLQAKSTRKNPVGIAKMIWISSRQQNGMYLTGLEMQSI